MSFLQSREFANAARPRAETCWNDAQAMTKASATEADPISAAKIIVVFATFNGAAVLSRTLSGYAAASKPERSWQLVVVNNASDDAAAEILASYQDRLPLTVLYEPVPSKNRALNRALDFVGRTADLYVFTDDDAIPERDYLQKWEQVLAERPNNELFGATVEPVFENGRPDWLARFNTRFSELYAMNERPAGEISPSFIYGPNMAIRRSVLLRGYRFNEDIGPNSSQANYPMGSETEFCVRVGGQSKLAAWFAPGPKVSHIVRPAQTTYEFIGRRAFRHGRGVAMRQALLNGGRLPNATWRGVAIQSVRWLAAKLSIGTYWWEFNWHRGYRSFLIEQAANRRNRRNQHQPASPAPP